MDKSESNKRSAKTGRRAKKNETTEGETFGGETVTINENQATDNKKEKTLQKPSKRMGGWGEESSLKSGRRRTGPDDERLNPQVVENENENENDDDIPVIPDLEEQNEADVSANSIAHAPSVLVNRVATYRELDYDLAKHAPFSSLDTDIDLKLLMKCLCSEVDVQEPDEMWDWERLFTEITSDLLNESDSVDDKETFNVTNVAV